MGTEHKFFYVKGTTKRDFLLASNQLQAIVDSDADTVSFRFENIGLDRDGTEAKVEFDITSGNAKQFVEDVLEHHAKNAFTVIADDIDIESVAGDYTGGAVTVSNEIA